jgi:SAM-dependent methyltransferase
MGTGQGPGVSTDVDLLRREYESSLSWRITRPLRALRRTGGTVRRRALRQWTPPAAFTPGTYDSWLEHFYDAVLTRIDAACAEGGRDTLALFRDLDDDLWALLLTQEYEVYPNIKALLPAVPDPALQQLWNGASGAALATQSKAFVRKLIDRYARHGQVPLAQARVLDFGCGWGRLTRFLGRDVAPGRLYGCDPVEQILELCRTSRVPARLARSDFLPQRLPFEETFDLAFAFSVFTHVSEAAQESCLGALHRSLRPGGILVVTIRPPQYLLLSPIMHPALKGLGPNFRSRLGGSRYVFVPHPAEPTHLQYEGSEMNYGETVITLPYVQERWSSMFELLDLDLLVGDLHQVMLTLRRR